MKALLCSIFIAPSILGLGLFANILGEQKTSSIICDKGVENNSCLNIYHLHDRP